jgi:hypothetical protein
VNITKASRRDVEISKRKNGHQVDGKGVFLIKEIQKKKYNEIKRNRIRKQERFTEGEI